MRAPGRPPLRRGRPRACPVLGAHKGRPYRRGGRPGSEQAWGTPKSPGPEATTDSSLSIYRWESDTDPFPSPVGAHGMRPHEDAYESPLLMSLPCISGNSASPGQVNAVRLYSLFLGSVGFEEFHDLCVAPLLGNS